MREYTVQFHSVNELAQFATIANRQPFPVHFDYQGSRLDAKSILSLCALPIRRMRILSFTIPVRYVKTLISVFTAVWDR